ncbi:MAG: DEAD/DEAH box helicase, partial [Oscillospiraceae bacterium]
MLQKIKLYKYQESAVQNAVTMLCDRGNSLIVAGTGAGKTIMMAAAIGRFYNGFYATHKKKPHVLVLVHRTEIHEQNHTKFERVCPEIPTSEITAERKSLHGNVHFGMVQTVVNLLDDFEKANSFFDLIVIDEAHHAKASTYEEIINRNKKGKPEACLLGVTATPNRGDKLPLIHLFDNYNQITTRFLIDSHYLVRPRFVDLSPAFGVGEKGHLSKNCKMDMQGKALIAQLCEEYLKQKEDGKAIIFAPSHEYCELIYNELKARGRNPAYLSLGLDDITRKSELERFENGDCEELINVDICTEGYDFPPLRNVVDFDTNGTQGQWIQKVGRVLRTSEGKTTCTVLDFGGNIDLYPDGVETGVDLDGVVKKPKGEHLSEDDFFKKETRDKGTEMYEVAKAEQYTPYNAPPGFETVSDTDFGIVFIACG